MNWLACFLVPVDYSSPPEFRRAVGEQRLPRSYTVTIHPRGTSDSTTRTGVQVRKFPVFIRQDHGVLTTHDPRVEVRGARLIVRNAAAFHRYLDTILTVVREMSRSRQSVTETLDALNRYLHPAKYPSLEHVMTNEQMRQVYELRRRLYTAVPRREAVLRIRRLPPTNVHTMRRQSARERVLVWRIRENVVTRGPAVNVSLAATAYGK